MILARYLIKEISQTLFAVCLVLMLIGLSGELVRVFSEVTSGDLGVDLVMIVLGLKSLNMLMVILPLSFYISILMTLSRLYQNNEMAAVSASGISQLYIVKIVGIFAVLFSILVGALSFQLVPWAKGLQQDITFESENSSELEGMRAGSFRDMLDGVMYIEDINDDRTQMSKVFLQQHTPNNTELVIRAEKGHRDVHADSGDKFIIFENGVRYQKSKSELDYTVIEFEKHGVRTHEKTAVPAKKKYAALPTLVLMNNKHPASQAELHARLAPVLLCILLAVIAVPLSETSPRQGQYLRLSFGLLVYIIVANLISIGRTWIAQGKIPSEFGLWWVYIIMLMVIAFLLIQQQGFRYLFMNKKNK